MAVAIAAPTATVSESHTVPVLLMPTPPLQCPESDERAPFGLVSRSYWVFPCRYQWPSAWDHEARALPTRNACARCGGLARVSNASVLPLRRQSPGCRSVTERCFTTFVATILLLVEERIMAAKYGRKASSKVKRAMHERKTGTLRSGRSGRKVKSRKQAIAIGLSEARRAGAKVPPKRASARRRTRRTASKRS